MEANVGEVKLEINEKECIDDIMDESELALWYLDHPVKTYIEEPSEDANDPLETSGEINPPSLNPRRRNYVHEGYKDPAMKEWDKELSKMIYKDGTNLFCKFCDYKHHRRGYALNHVEAYHPPKNFPCYKCLKCGDVVVSRNNFQAHILKVHAADPPVTAYEASSNIATSYTNKNIKTEPHSTFKTNGKRVNVELSRIEDTMNVESKLDENRQNSIEELLKRPDLKKWDELLKRMAYKPNENWNCKKCDYAHSRKGYVMNHIEGKHAPEGFPGYKCLKCCDRVKNRMSFLVHVTKCHKSNDVGLKEMNSVEKPQPPNKSLYLKSEDVPINKHNETLLLQTPPEADKIFLSKRISDYETYVKSKIASRKETKEVFTCEFCKRNFNDRPDWAEHMRKVHSQNFADSEETPFKCGLCGYRCARNDYLNLHMRKFHERVPVKFSHSQAPFFLPPVKIKAKQTAPRICQKCGGGFLDEESYTKHMTDVEGIDISKKGNTFRCEFCSYSFKYAATWRDHTNICRKLLTAKKFRFFTCVACSSKFKNGVTLKVHIEMCNSFKYMKMSNSQDSNGSDSAAYERSNSITDNEGSIESEIKLMQEVETPGNSNQLTLEETCSSLLDLLENVADKNET